MAFRRKEDEYYTVDFVPSQEQNLGSNTMHHRSQQASGEIALQIRLREKHLPSPLHVGSGDFELDEEGPYQPFIRWEEGPGVPGTGIKGAIRAYAEALSPSCEAGQCKVPRKGPFDKGCLCCSIFGTLGYMGRITFTDALLQGTPRVGNLGVPARWGGQVRQGRRFYWHCDYEYWTNEVEGSRERLEVVFPPAAFQSICFFQNLTEEDLGLLVLAMGLAPGRSYYLKLGGAKNRGFGSVAFEVENWHVVNGPSAYHTFQLESTNAAFQDKAKKAVEKYLASLTEKQRATVESNLQAFQQAELSLDRLRELHAARVERGRR